MACKAIPQLFEWKAAFFKQKYCADSEIHLLNFVLVMVSSETEICRKILSQLFKSAWVVSWTVFCS